MCISLRPSTFLWGLRSTWGHFVVMGVKSLFWYHLYSTFSWARAVAGWETKLTVTYHWILVASSLSMLKFQNAISSLGYMVGQNISGQGMCHRDDTVDDHIKSARSIAGWETKLTGTSQWILVASSLSMLKFEYAIYPLGYMVGQNISGQGMCHRDDTVDV